MSEISAAFQEEEILKTFGYTFGDENLFFDGVEQHESHSFCVFSSKSMINLIRQHIAPENMHVLIDGTFKTCPLGPFNQLLILHVRKHHQVFPFAFCLLSNKTQAAYTDVFRYIEQNVFKLSEVASFTTDYEIAMRNALRAINPNANMFACHFHFCQAAKKKATQTEGFIELIRKNKEAESIYYRLFCLPLLPAAFIKNAFESLQTEADALKKRPMKKFLAYFRKQWMDKVNKCIYI